MTEQEAIDLLNQEKVPMMLDGKNNEQLVVAHIKAIEALEKQMNDRWIPISERLPEAFEYVLVTSTACGRTIAHRMPKQTNWYDLHSTIVETGVIAWKPLPKPYTEFK